MICNKTFYKKSNYNYHINRKIPCIPPDGEQSIVDKIIKDQEKADKSKYIEELVKENRIMKAELLKLKKNNTQDTLKTNDLEVIEQQKLEQNHKQEQKEQIVPKILHKKQSKTKQKQQINNNCNITTNINNINVNNVNTNINQQNNINIEVMAFKKEDLSHLKDEMYHSILNKAFRSIPELTRLIHFNKNKPENYNIYISNKRDAYILVYDGEQWNLQNRDEILQQIMEDKADILEDKFNKYRDNLSEDTVRKFTRFQDQKDEPIVAKGIKEELELLLYNNRKMPIALKKQLEQIKK